MMPGWKPAPSPAQMKIKALVPTPRVTLALCDACAKALARAINAEIR